MSSPPGLRTAASHALWLGALLLTLAGLFGMHGLADHGIEQMDSAHAAMSTMAADVASTGEHLTQGTVVAVSTVVDAMVSHDPGGGTGMEMHAAAMCLAVLLLTLIAMIVHLHANRLRPVLLLTARPARAPVPSDRQPDPPSLYELSIQRC